MTPPVAAWLGTGEVARMLGVSAKWVAREARAGRLPCLRVGSRYRFSADDAAVIVARYRRDGVVTPQLRLVWCDPPADAWHVPPTRRPPLDVRTWAHG